jgi:hypothetical protein
MIKWSILGLLVSFVIACDSDITSDTSIDEAISVAQTTLSNTAVAGVSKNNSTDRIITPIANARVTPSPIFGKQEAQTKDGVKYFLESDVEIKDTEYIVLSPELTLYATQHAARLIDKYDQELRDYIASISKNIEFNQRYKDRVADANRRLKMCILSSKECEDIKNREIMQARASLIQEREYLSNRKTEEINSRKDLLQRKVSSIRVQ